MIINVFALKGGDGCRDRSIRFGQCVRIV